jgi:hypothetical protein
LSMKLNADDCRELRDDLDELLEAVIELKHELDSDNEEIKPNGKRNRKKNRDFSHSNYKKSQINGRRHH